QGTILAVELDYRAFRPNRPDEAVFTDEEIVDFTRRLDRLVEYAVAIETWCVRRLRNGYIGEGAWRESESLRSMTDVRWPGFRGATSGQDENTPWD
ncbi:MAG: hypothetical protein KDA71_21195, partial [Planctomycetales bacterium]|nr:hypothetical protein [Planctomycetales bacterium]